MTISPKTARIATATAVALTLVACVPPSGQVSGLDRRCAHLQNQYHSAIGTAPDLDCAGGGQPYIVADHPCGIELLGAAYTQPRGDCVGYVLPSGGRAVIATYGEALDNAAQVIAAYGP